MTKTFDRAVITIVFAMPLVIGLALLARTGFAAAVDVTDLASAANWIDPMRQVVGSLLITVPAVLLVQEVWHRSHPTAQRIPAESTANPGR